MIEKLQTWQRPLPNNPVVVENMGMDNESLFNKINELIDAVNWLGKSETEIRPENTNTYELYLKNKHLIGKLCKFKCAGGYCYGLLTNIKRKPCQWPFESLGRAFSTCEPVSPDDDIIYKGGSND